VALSKEGDTSSAGAPNEDGGATGVGEDPADDAAVFSGAVYPY
jgi:hypothetical protein